MPRNNGKRIKPPQIYRVRPIRLAPFLAEEIDAKIKADKEILRAHQAGSFSGVAFKLFRGWLDGRFNITK